MKISNFKFQIKTRGFTLIEVLVVIAIILILIGLSIVAFQPVRKAGRDTKRKSDLSDIRGSIEIYRTDCGTYPATIVAGSALLGTGTCAGNTYMAKVPDDPLPGVRRYRYAQISSNTYELCAALEQGSGTQTCGGSSDCGSGVTCNYKVTNP